MTGFDGGDAARQTHLISQGGRLRTLTPVEWERLQGFPDDWTAMVSTSARHRLVGNAMHVGMAAWLGHRLAAVHTAVPELRTPPPGYEPIPLAPEPALF